MSTHNRKKLLTAVGVAAATAAAPAAMFLGAGTAQAATAWAWPDSDPLGHCLRTKSRSI